MALKILDSKIAKYFLLALGICCTSCSNNDYSNESSELSQEDRYDFNKSTTTVNRSSDLRHHRTMDTRPRDEYDLYDYDPSKGPLAAPRPGERVYFDNR
jgi:hypothetical protein